MVGYIYLMTDTSNGKQYIGQHHYDKEELDPNYHGSGRIVRRIFEKRPETIKEEYVKTCYSQRELDEWEKYFIFTNNTLHPNGYNLQEGGCGGIPSEETRRKMSESMKGKNNTKRSKPVIQYTLSGEFVREWPSTNEAGRNGFNQRHISACCRGEYKTAYGYVWRYKGVIYEEEINYKTPNQRRVEALSKTVLQFTLSGEFVREWPSVCEAGRNGFKQSGISDCCRGKQKSHHGFIWKYKNL